MRWWDLLGVFGEFLTIVGFGATLYQVRKTRNATRAVERALRGHLTEVRRDEMIQNLQALEPIPRQVRKAVQLARWNQAGELLRAWKRHGTTVCLHRGQLESEPDELVHRLTISFKTTDQARAQVLARIEDHAELAAQIEQAVLDMEAVGDLLPFVITEEQKFKRVARA